MNILTPEQTTAINNFIELSATCFAIAYKTALALDLPEDVAEHFALQLLQYFMQPAPPNVPDLSALMARMTQGGSA